MNSEAHTWAMPPPAQILFCRQLVPYIREADSQLQSLEEAEDLEASYHPQHHHQMVNDVQAFLAELDNRDLQLARAVLTQQPQDLAWWMGLSAFQIQQALDRLTQKARDHGLHTWLQRLRDWEIRQEGQREQRAKEVLDDFYASLDR